MSEHTNLVDELKWRGLIYDIINEDELRKRLDEGPLTVYCGFDPTADSLHIGSLLPIVTLMRFLRAGNRVVVLTGGGTGLIGDPSGKRAERKLNPSETVAKWTGMFKTQIGHFIPFDEQTTFCVDNFDWLGKMSAIEMWRDFGRHFPVNYMLAKDSVKSRLENGGCTYLEFSYMIMQSIDFYTMHENPRLKVDMEIGGQDQWGNITAGMDLIRRIDGAETRVYGLTMPLITKSDGTKFGKTESGAVWLDANKTSPYEMYQFWINTADTDVIKFLKYYTFHTREEIVSLEESLKAHPEAREAQRTLARDLTALCHGTGAMEEAEKMSEALFRGEVKSLTAEEIGLVFKGVASASTKEDLPLIDALILLGAAKSRREAREFIQNGAVSVNGDVIRDIEAVVRKDMAFGRKTSVIRRGKKNWFLLQHE